MSYQSNVLSGSHTAALALLPNDAVVLGALNLLTISSHQESRLARVLGKIMPVGITTGGKTYAGSIGFSDVDDGALAKLYAAAGIYNPLALPRFNILILIGDQDEVVNQIPKESRWLGVIYGVRFADTSIVTGVGRPMVGEEYAYVAETYFPIIANPNRGNPNLLSTLGLPTESKVYTSAGWNDAY